MKKKPAKQPVTRITTRGGEDRTTRSGTEQHGVVMVSKTRPLAMAMEAVRRSGRPRTLTVDGFTLTVSRNRNGQVQIEDEDGRQVVPFAGSVQSLPLTQKEPPPPKRSLLSFRGVVPWDGTDAQERVNELRAGWGVREQSLRRAAQEPTA